MSTSLTELPDDVLNHIFSFITPLATASLRQVCTQFHTLVQYSTAVTICRNLDPEISEALGFIGTQIVELELYHISPALWNCAVLSLPNLQSLILSRVSQFRPPLPDSAVLPVSCTTLTSLKLPSVNEGHTWLIAEKTIPNLRSLTVWDSVSESAFQLMSQLNPLSLELLDISAVPADVTAISHFLAEFPLCRVRKRLFDVNLEIILRQPSILSRLLTGHFEDDPMFGDPLFLNEEELHRVCKAMPYMDTTRILCKYDFASPVASITSLDLRCSSTPSISLLLSSLPKLTHLSVSGMAAELFSQQLASSPVRLHSLSLTNFVIKDSWNIPKTLLSSVCSLLIATPSSVVGVKRDDLLTVPDAFWDMFPSVTKLALSSVSLPIHHPFMQSITKLKSYQSWVTLEKQFSKQYRLRELWNLTSLETYGSYSHEVTHHALVSLLHGLPEYREETSITSASPHTLTTFRERSDGDCRYGTRGCTEERN